jgi:pilus assembly protein CpaC
MRGTWFLLLVLLILVLAPAVSGAPYVIEMTLSVGDSQIFNAPEIGRVSTSNPDVVEIVVTGGREVLINAKRNGVAVVNIWSGQGILSYRITVQDNFEPLEKELAHLINSPEVQVIVNTKYVILNGEAETSLDADRAVAYAKMYRDNVINNLQVKTKYQVLLSIVVTEMRKESQKKYGFRWGSWVSTKDGVVFYDWQAAFMENPGHTIAHYPDNWGIGSILETMQKNGDAKILAAPSIVTVSEKEADFLAGGEIPVPIADGDKVRVDWKEYGIKLKVKPTISRDQSIALEVNPEVSSLDWANAVTVSGYKLPAIAVRKTSTNLQVKQGSTLVIGGLLKREDSKTVYKLPLLGDLPIIGSLFRSKDFLKGDTELLFFVTPTLIKDSERIDPKRITNPTAAGPDFSDTAKQQEAAESF